MAGELLLDTGALVALLDRSQRQHPHFAEFFVGWRGRAVSTEAVLTEATHLLGRIPGGRTACLDFVLAGGVVLVPASRSSLNRCRDLLHTYRDLPIDFADATLVRLAEDLGTDLVLTTDRRDLSVYRIDGKKPFKVFPDVP